MPEDRTKGKEKAEETPKPEKAEKKPQPEKLREPTVSTGDKEFDGKCPTCQNTKLEELNRWMLGTKTEVIRYQCANKHTFKVYSKV